MPGVSKDGPLAQGVMHLSDFPPLSFPRPGPRFDADSTNPGNSSCSMP